MSTGRSGPHKIQRKRDPPQRQVPFTVALWDKWQADRKRDNHTYVLLAGIQEMRALLCAHDTHSNPLCRDDRSKDDAAPLPP